MGEDDYRFEADNRGQDTPVAHDDPSDETNLLYFTLDVSVPLVGHLKSDDGSLPEVKGGTSTVNWAGNVIEKVNNSSSGDGRIVGNDAANYIQSLFGADTVFGGGGNDLLVVADGEAATACGAARGRTGSMPMSATRSPPTARYIRKADRGELQEETG